MIGKGQCWEFGQDMSDYVTNSGSHNLNNQATPYKFSVAQTQNMSENEPPEPSQQEGP